MTVEQFDILINLILSIGLIVAFGLGAIRGKMP